MALREARPRVRHSYASAARADGVRKGAQRVSWFIQTIRYSLFIGTSSPEFDVTGKLRAAQRAGVPVQDRGAKGPLPQSIFMTDQNTPGAVSPVCGDVVAAIVGRGIGSAIGVSRCRSRRRVGVPVATAIAIVGVTISTVAVSAVCRGATLGAAKIGLAATLETTQSASTIEAATGAIAAPIQSI